MKQLRHQIKSVTQLEEQIPADCPDIYHSIAYYCNPSSVSFNDFKGKKAGYQQANNILIGGDLVFDIDVGQHGMDYAKRNALACRDWLLEKGYRPITVFSGRGFHLRVTKHDLEIKEELPRNRLVEYRRLREPLLAEANSLLIQVDSEVTLSPKSIIRLIGSINSKTGTTASVVDLENFDVERVPVDATHGSATPKGNDDKERMEYQDSPTGPRLSELADTPTRFVFIGTQVFGTVNRQVLLIRFPLNTPMQCIKSRLESLVEQAHLAPFILVESIAQDRAFFALCPSAVEKEQIHRLLRDFKEAKTAYAKFTTRYLPLPLHLIAQIGINHSNAQLPISRAHASMLRKMFGIDLNGVKCGDSLLRIGIAEVR
jgi:hypothetical protein